MGVGVNGSCGWSLTAESDVSCPVLPAVVLWGVCEFTSPGESVLDAVPLPLSHCSS